MRDRIERKRRTPETKVPETLALTRQSGPKPADERAAAKQKFLDAMARTNNITHSCDVAAMARSTYSKWRSEGFLSEQELAESFERYRDMLRGEITKRTFVGIQKPLVQNGKVVRDEGGERVMVTVVDNRLLVEMAKHILPEWHEEATKVIVQSASGIPDEFCLTFDARDVSRDEFAQLQTISQAIEDRKRGVVDGTVVAAAEDATGWRR